MKLRTIFDQIVVGLILLVLWQLATFRFGFYWVSSPLLVAQRLVEWTRDGTLLIESVYTIGAALIGFVIGAVPGALIPLALRRLPIINAIIDPYILAGYALPKLAMTPLLIIWFGIGIWSKVALVASTSFFFLFYNTDVGVRGINPQLIRMAEIVGARESSVARLIVWPAALPYILAGVRVSLPFAIGGAAISEMLSSSHGLGFLIQSSAMLFDATGSFAAIVALTIILMVVNIAVNRSEQRLFSWRPEAFAAKKGVIVSA